MSLFFLSFCNPALPEGSRFVGACIVWGGVTGDDKSDLRLAIETAWRLDCNPGGEVSAQRIPDPLEPHVRTYWRYRLLTRRECEEMDAELKPHTPS